MSHSRPTARIAAGILLAPLLLPFPAQGAQGSDIADRLLCELMQKPASTRNQTRGVHTPAVRPGEYRAKMSEARAAEQRVQQNRAKAQPAPRFTHPRKNAKPRMSSDRLSGR